jgi:uncharacterized protein YacL (UPF0231 family)
MQTKMGPNQVKMSIEHDFLHKRYSQALKTALEYIAAVEDEAVECKVSNPKEVVETAAMCAMKLGDMEIAMQCADKLVCNSSFLRHTHDMLARTDAHIIVFFLQNSRELGSTQTRGIIYMHGERYEDAISCFVEYNRHRLLDYKPWR